MSMDESAPGTPMRCSDAASIDIDDLTQCLQATNLDGKRKDQWNFFPPGTSREEQLRIINGEPPLAAPKKSTEEKEGEVKMTVAEAMDAHLATLAQISASAAVNDTPATPSTARQAPTPPASPDSALELLKTHYREALRTGTSPNALPRAPLPKNNHEIELLSVFMADEVHAWSQEMSLGGVVFSPLTHPCYPHWLSSSYLHPSTAVIQKVFEQMTGSVEATEATDASSDANLSFLDDVSSADVVDQGEETEEDEDMNRVPGSMSGSMAMDISFGK
jgi:hypothetical protein